MNALLATYGLPYEPFRDCLQAIRGVVAGSAALAIYLEEHHLEAGYEPNDMDVWIPIPSSSTPLTDLLYDHGYVLLRLFKQADHYAQQIQHITRILTFQHPTSRRVIQLIHVDVPHVVHEHIIPQFDISVCMTWWDPYTETADTFLPEMTLKRQMLLPCASDPSITDPHRFRARVEKYKARGFTVAEPPPASETVADERPLHALQEWKGRTAFDVFSYEDVDISDHLSASEWNIVIHVGTAWYAFERRALFDYLKTHGTCDRTHGWMYDTPYRQTITEEACASLLMADHSVYELIRPQSYTTHRNTTKTFYTVRAYSLTEWALEKPRRIFPHPVLAPPLAPLIPASSPLASVPALEPQADDDELYESIRAIQIE